MPLIVTVLQPPLPLTSQVYLSQNCAPHLVTTRPSPTHARGLGLDGKQQDDRGFSVTPVSYTGTRTQAFPT